MTSNRPTRTFDHQTLDYRMVLSAIVAFHDFMATPLGGFHLEPNLTSR